jgi:hypothetical protein
MSVQKPQTQCRSGIQENLMPSLLRSGQIISQVLRDKVARAGFAPDFYIGLMRSEDSKELLDQALALRAPFGLMKIDQLISRRLRYTLR